MKESLNFVLYARKSTEDKSKQVQSNGDQVEWAEGKAREGGLKLFKPYLKEEKSAKKPNNRPVFDQMLELIESGQANAIITWKLDRLSRNPIDSARIQW